MGFLGGRDEQIIALKHGDQRTEQFHRVLLDLGKTPDGRVVAEKNQADQPEIPARFSGRKFPEDQGEENDIEALDAQRDQPQGNKTEVKHRGELLDNRKVRPWKRRTIKGSE